MNCATDDMNYPKARRTAAFTLIELLVVMSVTAVLAALVLGTAGIAVAHARKARTEAERNMLIVAIEAYKNKKGSYPQDNTNNPAINPLFYELTGTVFTNNDSTYLSLSTRQPFAVGDVRTLFNRDGFVNSSRDVAEVDDFMRSTAKGGRTATVVTSGLRCTIFGINVGGPLQLADVDGRKINPWRYVSTNPTNNGESYDLWMDVYYGGKTNRISNWTRDPQPQ